MKTKRCSCCHQWKALSEFHVCRANKDGLKYACKSCKKEKVRIYNLKHGKEVYIRSLSYRMKNAEHISKRQKEYAKKNKEHILEVNRLYRQNNKNKIKKANIAYNKTEKGNACRQRSNHIRRDRMRSTTNNFTAEDWNIVLDFQNNKCWNCGCEMNTIFMDVREATREHVIKVKNGGDNTYGNIIALCRSCNTHKVHPFAENGVPDYLTALMAVS